MSNTGKKLVDIDQLRVFFSEELKKRLKESLEPIKESLEPINKRLSSIEAFLKNKGYAVSHSFKQITEKGLELLNKHKVDSYLEENCLLLKDTKLKEKTDPQIFIECLNWVKSKGREKVVEIMLHSNITESQCNEIVSLLLLNKIKPKNQSKKQK